jgi:hypothetical protein
MLYPNFDDFASLSTNHLEPGSHVKNRTKEKQDLFQVPLIQNLRQMLLPDGRLVDWEELPVLNLTGSLVSLIGLAERGLETRNELFDCADQPAEFDARSLMCVSTPLD